MTAECKVTLSELGGAAGTPWPRDRTGRAPGAAVGDHLSLIHDIRSPSAGPCARPPPHPTPPTDATRAARAETTAKLRQITLFTRVRVLCSACHACVHCNPSPGRAGWGEAPLPFPSVRRSDTAVPLIIAHAPSPHPLPHKSSLITGSVTIIGLPPAPLGSLL